MSSVLSIEKLNKRYGRIQAVNDLSLEVEAGCIFGLLGPNGSGKTTTLGMVLDAIHPSSGSFRWFGEEPQKGHLKQIGAILETPLFYPYLSGERNLKIVAEIKEVGYDRIRPILDRVGLLSRKDSLFRTYSLGMKQRLAIAGALLSNPKILILDEPTNGLDPQGIAEIRTLIKEIAKEGTTIILASHLLDEVEKVCSHVGVMKSGKLLFSGRVEEVLRNEGYFLLASAEMGSLREAILKYRDMEILGETEGKLLLRGYEGMKAEDLNRRLFEAGVVLSHLSEKKTTLEEGFLRLLSESSS